MPGALPLRGGRVSLLRWPFVIFRRRMGKSAKLYHSSTYHSSPPSLSKARIHHADYFSKSDRILMPSTVNANSAAAVRSRCGVLRPTALVRVGSVLRAASPKSCGSWLCDSADDSFLGDREGPDMQWRMCYGVAFCNLRVCCISVNEITSTEHARHSTVRSCSAALSGLIA